MISEPIYLHFLNSLLEGNKQQAINIVSHLLNQNVDLKDIFINLFQRSMYRIGSMWETDKCTVADEHIATRITEGLIELVVHHNNGKPKNGKVAIITCVDKEFHELGAHIISGYLEVNQWTVYFVGSNTPQEDILTLIKEKNPDLIGISNNFYIHFLRLIKLIQSINREFPNLKIIVGGQALAEPASQGMLDFPNVSYIDSLNSLDLYLQKNFSDNSK